MNTLENRLKEMIIEKYGNVKTFTSKIGMPNSTFVSILRRGVNNANVNNIKMICEALNISTEALAAGQIMPVDVQPNKNGNFSDINDLLSFVKINILTTKDISINGEALTNDERQTLVDAFELSCELLRRKATRRILENGGL